MNTKHTIEFWLVLCVVVVAGTLFMPSTPLLKPQPKGEGTLPSLLLSRTDRSIRTLRQEHEALRQEETKLRAELLGAQGGYDLREQIFSLSQERSLIESEIRNSLLALKEARNIAIEHTRSVSKTLPRPTSTRSFHLQWPVFPREGISAGFQDMAYKERFHLDHNAIDIPVSQGSPIFAAEAGTVLEAIDNGYGFNVVLLEHKGGFVTLYGHVSDFFVQKGQSVLKGQPIARSGGAPGSPGAGRLTTGPHLHFEVVAFGEHIDPLTVLPSLPPVRY